MIKQNPWSVMFDMLLGPVLQHLKVIHGSSDSGSSSDFTASSPSIIVQSMSEIDSSSIVKRFQVIARERQYTLAFIILILQIFIVPNFSLPWALTFSALNLSSRSKKELVVLTVCTSPLHKNTPQPWVKVSVNLEDIILHLINPSNCKVSMPQKTKQWIPTLTNSKQ